eukprot:scaffold321753_cov32-Tisochrysis_lutea.AAC.2
MLECFRGRAFDHLVVRLLFREVQRGPALRWTRVWPHHVAAHFIGRELAQFVSSRSDTSKRRFGAPRKANGRLDDIPLALQ